MKIIIAADIHYGVGHNQKIVRNFVKKITRTNTDVLLLVGDTFAFHQHLIVECLTSFAQFSGMIIHSKTKVNQYLRSITQISSGRV